MTNNKNDYPHYNVTYGEQINYVFITLKELIIIQWEYIRENRLWGTKSYFSTVNRVFVENN